MHLIDLFQLLKYIVARDTCSSSNTIQTMRYKKKIYQVINTTSELLIMAILIYNYLIMITLIFWALTFCLLKKKKTLDLQMLGQIGKTTKQLRWIPDTILSTSSFMITRTIFWCLHIWWHQNWFIYLSIEKH